MAGNKPKTQRLWFMGALVAETRRGGCTGNGLCSSIARTKDA